MREIIDCKYIESWSIDLISQYIHEEMAKGFFPKGKLQIYNTGKTPRFIQKLVKYKNKIRDSTLNSI